MLWLAGQVFRAPLALRFDIAVNHPLVVQVLQPLGDVPRVAAAHDGGQAAEAAQHAGRGEASLRHTGASWTLGGGWGGGGGSLLREVQAYSITTITKPETMPLP